VLLDSGNLSNIAARLPGVIQVMADLGYDAVGVGDVDLRVSGREFFSEAQKHNLAVIDPDPSAPKTALPCLIKNVGGVRVGVVSFGATGEFAPCSEFARRKAAFSAFVKARQESDVLIVLDQANVISADWLDRNGSRLGRPDIVISGQSKVGLAQPEVVGKTYIVPTSFQARSVGVIDLEVGDGGPIKTEWKFVPLDEKVAEDDKTKSIMQEFIYKSTVPTQQQVTLPVRQGNNAEVSQAQTKPYYSPALCKACHVREYEDWAKTKHAAAIKVLIDQNKVTPECLECHSEHYRRLQTAAMPPNGIGGVDCATCHIDALPHGSERSQVGTRTKVSSALCLDCHTKERSPKYDQVVYFPQVAHASAATAKSTTAALAKP
jgi:hypothetical protein